VRAYSVKDPAGVTLATLLAVCSVTQRLLSGPRGVPWGPLEGGGAGYSVTPEGTGSSERGSRRPPPTGTVDWSRRRRRDRAGPRPRARPRRAAAALASHRAHRPSQKPFRRSQRGTGFGLIAESLRGTGGPVPGRLRPGAAAPAASGRP